MKTNEIMVFTITLLTGLIAVWAFVGFIGLAYGRTDDVTRSFANAMVKIGIVGGAR